VRAACLHSIDLELTRSAERALRQAVTENLRWVVPRIDMDVPHPARMHDYWLGGGHNFPADRELAAKIMRFMPGIEDVSRINQAFGRRAALFLMGEGVHQFLDIGSGIPTVGNLHEIVHRVDPLSRVVYADGDPVAVAHTELILRDTEGAAVIQADIRDVDGLLDAEVTRRVLDLSKPVALFAPAMHFVPDDSDPAGVLAHYRDRLASGSYLVLAHGTTDTQLPGQAELIEAYRATRYQLFLRSHAEILRMCAGFDLVEPGLVGLGQWRPEGPGDQSAIPEINRVLYAAVGRKP
jgi:hypothetical protein